jgi:hypothetical protein
VLGLPAMRSPALTCLVLALLLFPPLSRGADPAPGPPPLLQRSSLAAVLAQGGALKLTPEQVKALEQADSRLARDQEAVRAAQPHPEDAPSGAASGPPSSRPPGGSGTGPASGGPGGGMSGGKSRPPQPRKSGPDPAAVLQQQLDALDTEAFLKAVDALPEAQREKAIEIASRHRELIFEQRERER